MAEALLREEAGDRFESYSAGLEPRPIWPETIQVMNEIGIDLEGQRPKSLSEFLGRVPIRYAIIVCSDAESKCPRVWPFGAAILSWPFEDPAAFEGSEQSRLEKFRDVRDQIRERIQTWIREVPDV